MRLLSITSILIFFLSVFLVSCKSSSSFTGFSYDPPGVVDTSDKEIQNQPRRVIGADEPRVWVDNEFDGARVSDFYALNDSTFEVFIKAENYPINSSPWYAFKIWSDTVRQVNIQLNYQEADHRYIPKLNSWVQETQQWEEQMELPVSYDSVSGTATFELMLAPDPLVISGQPLHTSSGLLDTLSQRGIIGNEFTETKVAGFSKLGRPITELRISENKGNDRVPVLAIVGRQHPPEVTGYQASLYFLEELTSDTELARSFRQAFDVVAFPMLNPDGVDLGHWRHNAGGIDLNRDWVQFNQPETQIVRDVFTALQGKDNRELFYAIDFHSTNENIFYPITEEVKTTPDNITQKWMEQVITQNPDILINVEEFDPSSPIAKNWFYRSFGIDAVTYEVDDQISSDHLDAGSRSAARLLMQLLLDEWEMMKSEME